MSSMLTTVDNPWDPVTNYREWDQWDREAGYCTNAYLARIASTIEEELNYSMPSLTPVEENYINEEAIKIILRIEGPENYKRIQIPD